MQSIMSDSVCTDGDCVVVCDHHANHGTSESATLCLFCDGNKQMWLANCAVCYRVTLSR